MEYNEAYRSIAITTGVRIISTLTAKVTYYASLSKTLNPTPPELMRKPG